MSRLHSEWRRLYLPPSAGGHEEDPKTARLTNSNGLVRAMVLELARPADWETLSAVWRGVQVDLGLPAPGIAVSGRDAYQLWFSLSEALPAVRAAAFLEALRSHYLPRVAPERISLLPTADAETPELVQHASLVPAQQPHAEQWSAFVAPDLAPVFADTPWLDFPPGDQGQADLLAQLDSIGPADLERAQARLNPQLKASTDHQPPLPEQTQAEPCLDPRHFLLKVMNDESVTMALRIEAAKALLPYPALQDTH